MGSFPNSLIWNTLSSAAEWVIKTKVRPIRRVSGAIDALSQGIRGIKSELEGIEEELKRRKQTLGRIEETLGRARSGF